MWALGGMLIRVYFILFYCGRGVVCFYFILLKAGVYSYFILLREKGVYCWVMTQIGEVVLLDGFRKWYESVVGLLCNVCGFGSLAFFRCKSI